MRRVFGILTMLSVSLTGVRSLHRTLIISLVSTDCNPAFSASILAKLYSIQSGD